MAVDQNAISEFHNGLGEQAPQGGVIGLVDMIDAGERFFRAEWAGVDFLIFRDNLRNRAEAVGDPCGAGVGKGGKRGVEHRRIEFIGLAIDIEPGSGKACFQDWRTVTRGSGKKLVDQEILRAPKREAVEPGSTDELQRIIPPGMGGIENKRPASGFRMIDLKELVVLHEIHVRPFHLKV